VKTVYLLGSILIFLCLATAVVSAEEGIGISGAEDFTLLCTGGLILTESALLLAGMNIPEPSPWSNGKNITLAASDILLGGTLVWFSLSGTDYRENPLYYGVLLALGVTHLYREGEYFLARDSQPFAANLPLFLLNNVRLGLIGGSLGLSLSLKY